MLTPRQREAYEFICRFRKATGVSPTIREIGAELGIQSPNGVLSHLRALKTKQMINWTPHRARAVVPLHVDWHDNHDNITALGRHLLASGFSAEDLQRYYEHPDRWTEEWQQFQRRN